MITANIASYLPLLAKKQPDTFSVVVQDKNKLKKASYDNAYTYQQLDEVSDRIANGLQAYGIKKGTRTVVMVKPVSIFLLWSLRYSSLKQYWLWLIPAWELKIWGNVYRKPNRKPLLGIVKQILPESF